MDKLFLSLLIVVTATTLHAQDPSFTQYHSTPLYLNPAFAGAAGCSRVVTSYRNQWTKLKSPYVTTQMSYDQFINPIRGGVGLSYLNDIEGGTLHTARIGLIYSPHFNIEDRITVKPALEFTYFMKSIDFEQLNFGDEIDPKNGFIFQTSESIGDANINGLDLSSGFLIYSKKLYGGFAIHHILEPEEGFLGSSKLPLKTTSHLGYTFCLNDSSNFAFSPSFVYHQQRDFYQLNTIFSFRYKWLLWGIEYRKKDTYAFMVGYLHKFFRISYSYDYIFSKFSNQHYGSHEASLSVLFNCKNKKNKVNTINVLAF